jgi:carboxypeptidase C (cathepsin A)
LAEPPKIPIISVIIRDAITSQGARMSDQAETSKEKTTEPAKPEPKDQLVETQHQITIGDQTIAYKVVTGTIVLKEEAEKTGDKAGEAEGEKAKATVFFIAYTRTDVDDAAGAGARRPITFSFKAGRGRRRCGCTRAHWGRAVYNWTTWAICPSRPIS